MASYSSFKKIESDAIVDTTILPGDIASDTIEDVSIGAKEVPAAAFSGSVTSAKLGIMDLSAKTVTYRPVVNNDVSASANIAGGKLGTTAVTDNLGYTPLDQAGGTNTASQMTGPLTITRSGTSSSTALAGGTGTNTGIYYNSGVALTVSGSEMLRIETNGIVRKPNLPAFAAVGTRGWMYGNTWGAQSGTFELLGSQGTTTYMGWTTSHQTGGSNFSNTTGRYTAPVSGYYYFQTMWYLLNDNNITGNYVHCFFARTGTLSYTPGSRVPYTIDMHGNRNNYPDGANYQTVMYLSATNYCSLYIRYHDPGSSVPTRGTSRMHAGHQVFSGFLIG